MGVISEIVAAVILVHRFFSSVRGLGYIQCLFHQFHIMMKIFHHMHEPRKFLHGYPDSDSNTFKVASILVILFLKLCF
jgi:hypothetical protein